MSLNLTADALRRAANIREQIEKLEAEYAAILSGASVAASGGVTRRGRKPGPKPKAEKVAAGEKPARKKRKLSPEARERIVAAVKARWAREKGDSN